MLPSQSSHPARGTMATCQTGLAAGRYISLREIAHKAIEQPVVEIKEGRNHVFQRPKRAQRLYEQ